MKYIQKKVIGIPYGKNKARGNTEAPKIWTDAVIQQTHDLSKISDACIFKVTFYLPPEKFPTDFPYGPDLDNLLKRFLDALNHTVFSESKGKDSCIISINATKTKAESENDCGASFEILPISV